MKVGDKVKRSPKIWKAPAMQFVGKIVETAKGGFKVDFDRYSINPWNGKKEKDVAVFYTATELVLVK